MTVQARTANRRFVALVALGIVFALATTVWLLAGCAPKAASSTATPQQEQDDLSASTSNGQAVNWTMGSDCATCHTSEAESAADAVCVQGVAHEAEGITCVQCHTEESVLSSAHADVKFGDKPGAKATVATVDSATCESCHGALQDVAALTAASTALTDDKGTTVNPHERPAGEKHDANPAVCTDCHNNHSDNLAQDAQKYCAQCHHRGVYECGTCHELRDR